MKNIFCLLLLILVNLSALATTNSWGEMAFRWKKKEVSVCWYNSDPINRILFTQNQLAKIDPLSRKFITLNPTVKDKIRQIITTEYTSARTGVNFVGWKSCAVSESYDVVLLVGDTTKTSLTDAVYFGYASVGREDDVAQDLILPDSKKAFLYIDVRIPTTPMKISPLLSILRTSLHEFGHLAGLRHEHVLGQFKGEFGAEPTNTGTMFSAVDYNSIMDYRLMGVIAHDLGTNFYVQETPDLQQRRRYKNLNVFTRSQFYFKFDPTIFIEGKPLENMKQYNVRSGLSSRDVHGLRCMYLFDREHFVNECNNHY